MSDPSLPTVHIGIVAYHSLPDLPECLAHVARQTYPHVHCTVLDNASNDDCAAWIARNVPNVRFIQNHENVGFGRAHNQILALSPVGSGDFYLALNPDVRLSPTCLVELMRAFSDPRVGWATGKLTLLDDPKTLYSAGHALRRDGYALNIGYRQPDTGQFDQPRRVFGAPGAAVLIHQRVIASIAPDGRLFDHQMFLYYEDVDLDWRANRAGFTCAYLPTATALHRGSTPTKTARTQALINRYSSVLKNAYWRDLIFYNLPILFAHCLARLIFSPRAGLTLITGIARNAPAMFRKRTKPVLPHSEMRRWFTWAAEQPTGQATRWSDRAASGLKALRNGR